MKRAFAVCLILLVSCDKEEPGDPPVSHGDTAVAPVEELCGNGAGPLPDGLVVLEYHDGTPVGDLESQGWSVSTTVTYTLGEEHLYEAMRFELEHPAIIYGFEVMWTQVPDDDPDKKLAVGLYADFGYNGFDFWAPDPLAESRRCAGDAALGEWISYALEEPVTIDHPGLVYVAHERKGAGKPGWALDASADGDGTCGVFDECRAAVNLPEAELGSYYNGLSLALPYDYLVRLHVEYTDDLADDERIFQLDPDGPNGYRLAWGDYDDDGDDDLLASGSTLYRNDGGAFTDVSDAAGLAGLGASGGVWGDYDNDGCLDIFAFRESYSAGDYLLHSNCDGTFSEVGALAGIDDVQDYNDCDDAETNVHAPTPAAAWWDIDNDGWLDLYLANFNCWTDYSHYVDTVFHNEGDGTFTEWTGLNGFSEIKLASRGANPVDHDGDGDVDLLVNNYVLERNLFYENNGDGTVTEHGEALGLAGHPDSVGVGANYFGHTIGTAWGDLDNDGDFDSVQANLAHPRFYHFSDKTQVLLNDGTGSYSDISGDWAFPASDAGLRFQETHSVPVLADFDNDGVLDLVISAVYDGRPTDFYWGLGDGTFALDAYHAGIDAENGWGMAAADYDGDGDVDLAVHGGLYENTGSGGSWLQVKPVGNVDSNWAAIGATVRVTAGSSTWMRYVQGGSGQGCQDSQTLHFGLGSVSSVDAIEVDFPGGGAVSYAGPFDADQRLVVFEDGSTSL